MSVKTEADTAGDSALVFEQWIQDLCHDELFEHGTGSEVAYDLISNELLLDGSARLNLATFATTWMPPPAAALMAKTADKNMIDKDEYPQTAEIERRCVNIIWRLWHASGKGDVTGCSTTGSSEAMRGGLTGYTSAPRRPRPCATRTRSASWPCLAPPSTAAMSRSAKSARRSTNSQPAADPTSRSTSTEPQAGSSPRSCSPSSYGTSGLTGSSRSTPPDTSTAWSTPVWDGDLARPRGAAA